MNLGNAFEAKVCEYLQNAGLKLLEKNYRVGHWELDLIMKDGKTVVFVEVKYRKNELYGGAISALSASQIERLRMAAQAYLQKKQLNESKTPCRFDLVAVTGQLNSPNINWIKNAF